MSTLTTETVEKTKEDAAALSDGTCSVGTLTYTKMGLLFLFIWLLWGDFCFILMENVFSTLLPLKLKDHDATNTLIGILVTTVPSTMTFFVNPIISFRSDRYRSRWGRRRPFLLLATPFIGVFLILIGFSSHIAAVLHRFTEPLIPSLSLASLSIVLVAVFIIGFQFFNLFIMSVYYYLFNDVVPQKYLARFISLFRTVGAAAIAFFNFFIFKYAQTHMTHIFVGAAVLFCTVFTLMCLKVKEGDYPPPPENVDRKKGVLSSIQTYFVECFCHRFYWYFFLGNACWSIATCITVFNIFLYLSLGLDVGQVGKIGGTSASLCVLLLYPAGMLADKLHPLRMMLIVKSCFVFVMPLNLIFLFVDVTPNKAFWVVGGIVMLTLPFSAMYQATILPMFMRLLPKDRYGQFSSANAMVQAFCLIFGSVLAGLFVDLMKRFHPGSEFYYRYIPIWIVFFEICSLVFLILLYRKWKEYGGVTNYSPPSAHAPGHSLH